MIPANITREHILLAIKEISQHGVPDRRQSRDFALVFGAGFFPPKYIISVANRYANGYELDSSLFSGGRESNSFLTGLGFQIVRKATPVPHSESPLITQGKPTRIARLTRGGHSERCQACKESIRKFLTLIYGETYSNHALEHGTLPKDFAGSPFYSVLQEIYESLQEFRGHTDFVRTQRVPPVDYFIPSPGFIVEFDESQHFTACRKLTLSKYPSNLLLGFDREKWMKLCDKIGARDDEPAYRDEQRAWYDTLRDFLPATLGLKPTVRLFASHLEWCKLDPDEEEDISKFSRILQANLESNEDSKQSSFLPSRKIYTSDTFRVALVVPEVCAPCSDEPNGTQPQYRYEPIVPSKSDFDGEYLDLIIFPEAYIRAEDNQRLHALRSLSVELKTHLLVGASERHGGRRADWETLLLFDPCGEYRTVYYKHATAGAVAFERSDWNPEKQLPVFRIGNVCIGCTICHDSYLGLLQRLSLIHI